MGLARGIDEADFFSHACPFKPDRQGQLIGIPVFCPELNGLDRISGMIEVHDQLFRRGIALDDVAERLAFGFHIDIDQLFQR